MWSDVIKHVNLDGKYPEKEVDLNSDKEAEEKSIKGYEIKDALELLCKAEVNVTTIHQIIHVIKTWRDESIEELSNDLNMNMVIMYLFKADDLVVPQFSVFCKSHHHPNVIEEINYNLSNSTIYVKTGYSFKCKECLEDINIESPKDIFVTFKFKEDYQAFVKRSSI